MNELKPNQPSQLYDTDFYVWSHEQAQRLRVLKPEGLDWENVAEEIESLGKSDRRALRSDVTVILEHLIKWRFQPEKRTASWSRSIDEHRNRIRLIIDDSPTLRAVPQQFLADDFDAARRLALKATGLSEKAVPKICPFTVEQVLDPDYLP